MKARHLGNERGQAVTETMMASWIIILFVAAVYQMFLANQTIYRSLVSAHVELMSEAFKWNCAGTDLPFMPPGRWCDYQGGARKVHPGEPARVIWNRWMVPEIYMPVVGIFEQREREMFSGDQSDVYGPLVRSPRARAHPAAWHGRLTQPFSNLGEFRLWSVSTLHQLPDTCGSPFGVPVTPPCKRTKAGAGPYLPLLEAFTHLGSTGIPVPPAAPQLGSLVDSRTQLLGLIRQLGQVAPTLPLNPFTPGMPPGMPPG